MRVADAVLLEPGVGEELGGALAVLRVADEALLEEAEALRCDDVGRVVNRHGGVGADVEECGHGREVVVGGLPVRISRQTQPTDQMSDFGVGGFISMTSGAIQ